MAKLNKRVWWGYLHEDLKELLTQSQLLVETVENWSSTTVKSFHDYSFVVFPAAKAYEGFLKTLFKDLGFISGEDFYGKRFRIGKALNPALEGKIRKSEGVYDRLVDYCSGKELANVLWKTWKQCRNLLFHWFPNERNAIDFEEARERVMMILDAMDFAYEECMMEEEDIK